MIKVSTGLVSSVASLLSLLMAVFPYVFTWCSLCAYVSFSFFLKDINHIGSGPTPVTSLNLNYFFKDSVSSYIHILKFCLEPDILECGVKWASESITTNKASGGDGIPVELFQILKDDAVKVLHSICQQIWKTQQ